MIKKTSIKLAVIILLTAINSCYYEREIHEELEICFIRGGNIWIMNMDGSSQRQITDSGEDNMPSWSPDGKRILFERGSGIANIYIINSDGKNLKQLSTIKSSSATWSADGENIFYHEENGSDYSIIAAKPDGTNLRKYPITNQANALSASPDGKYIYYLKIGLSCQIDLISGIEYISSTFFLDHGSVSPDGNNIAYYDGANIRIYNIITKESTYFYSGYRPCWTPDGKTIVFQSLDNIYKITIDSSDLKELTTFGVNSNPCVKWKPK